MPQWRPSATSNHDIGGNSDTTSRLAIQCEGLGAADVLKVYGRVSGAAAYMPVGVRKQQTDAFIDGATGISNDNNVFEAEVSGLEIQLQFTKTTAGPFKINFNRTSGP